MLPLQYSVIQTGYDVDYPTICSLASHSFEIETLLSYTECFPLSLLLYKQPSYGPPCGQRLLFAQYSDPVSCSEIASMCPYTNTPYVSDTPLYHCTDLQQPRSFGFTSVLFNTFRLQFTSGLFTFLPDVFCLFLSSIKVNGKCEIISQMSMK